MERRLARSERGFTLIEVLVVTVVIGVLAAIAVPTFLHHTSNAEDADAKTNARNMATYVASCFARDEDYTKCSTETEVEPDSLDWGSGPGQVAVTSTTKDSYEIVAVSKRGHTFNLARASDGHVDRTCTAPANDPGGCKNGTW